MPSRKSLLAARSIAWLSQHRRCFYCQLLTWLGDPQDFCQATGLTPKQARPLQCTAEHLEPKSNGGSNNPSNIVAACRYCNQLRHRYKRVPSPEAHKTKIRSQVARGKWHSKALLESCLPK
ncbi:MAG: HNH endonuclease [bacterium]|nr:HNH endonuclease [Betaproteobacteria bacterium]